MIKYVVDGVSAVVSGKAFFPTYVPKPELTLRRSVKNNNAETRFREASPMESIELQTLEDSIPAIGIFAQVRDFPWAEYLRLQEAFENHEHMSTTERYRWIQLSALHKRLEEFEGFEPLALTQSACQTRGTGQSFTVPGIRQMGCGASGDTNGQKTEMAAKPDKYDGKTVEEALEIWEEELNGLAWVHAGIESAKTDLILAVSGILFDGGFNLSKLNLSREEWEIVLGSVPQIWADRVSLIEFTDSPNMGVLPTLERFTGLTDLNAGNCGLTGVARLPVSVSQLNLDGNKITSWGFVAGLVNLQTVSVGFAGLTEFPTELYQRLTQNRVPGQLKPALFLAGNPISAVLIASLTDSVALTIDNHPNNVQQFWGTGYMRSGVITFYGTYPDLIVPGVYLGDKSDLENIRILSELGVKRIMNCANECSRLAQQMSESMGTPDDPNLHLDDTETQRVALGEHAETLHNYIRQRHTVLVNCAQGKSRSATLVIAYLMKYENMTLVAAIKHVKERRSIIHPNPGFMRQLVDLQLSLRVDMTLEAVLIDLAGQLPDIHVATESPGAVSLGAESSVGMVVNFGEPMADSESERTSSMTAELGRMISETGTSSDDQE